MARRFQGRAALEIVGLVFIGLGLLGLLAGGILGLGELRGPRTARAEGTVISAGRPPVVRFTTEAGATVDFSSMARSSSWREGDRLPVAYAPENPSEAAVDGFAGRWLVTGLFAGLGSVFAVIGGALCLAGRSGPRPP